MRSKVIFGHPKWPLSAILYKNAKKRIAVYWSEMARNATERDFRSSKMVVGGHFIKKIKKEKLRIDLKWQEMRSKMILGHRKWLPAGIL